MGYRWLRRKLLMGVGALAASISLLPALAYGPAEQAIRLQQEALIWTTDYEGLIDGKVGEGTIAAIRKFQVGLGHLATGALSDDEVVKLYNEGFAKRDAVKFQQITDNSAGVSVGIPKGLFPAVATERSWGKSWYSKENGIAVDTLRFTNDISLRDLYDKLLTINNRTVGYSRYVDDSWFAISAFEGDAAIYVRADLVHFPDKPDEIRGFSIWMSGKRPQSYQSIAPAMLSSFRSNTDTSRDVSSIRPSPPTHIGGPLVAAPPPDPSHIETRPVPASAPIGPIGPIATQNNRPPPVGDCFRGLGSKCPITAFAFRP